MFVNVSLIISQKTSRFTHEFFQIVLKHSLPPLLMLLGPPALVEQALSTPTAIAGNPVPILVNGPLPLMDPVLSIPATARTNR